MACGCDSNMGCDCTLQAGSGIQVTGLGTAGDPFIITNSRPQIAVADSPSVDLTRTGDVITAQVRLDPVLDVADSATVDMTLNGLGTEASPFVMSAAIKGMVLEPSTTGQVMTRKPDGSWGPGPATQAPSGSVSTSNGLQGDGSGGSPVRISARTYAQWEAVIDAAVF